MVLQNPHSYPASPTPTIDVSFDRLNESALPPPPPLWPHRTCAGALDGTDVSAELGALRSRLEGIEQTQGRMMAEFEALKTQFTTVGINVNGNGVESGGGGVATDAAAQTAKIEALEKKLNELSETVKIDQERLPARLHNSRATVMKATLKTPVAANGKPVAGFPISRGEFEHITKERYEALMKGYGMPFKGDTAAKREVLRLFAGIPQDGQ